MDQMSSMNGQFGQPFAFGQGGAFPGTNPMQAPYGNYGYGYGYTATACYQYNQMPAAPASGYSSYQQSVYDRDVASSTSAGNHIDETFEFPRPDSFPNFVSIKSEAPSSPDSGVDGYSTSDESLSHSGSFGPGALITALGTYDDQKPAPGKVRAGKTKVLDKNSDEYREKRDRNNVAVAKSRQKKKERDMATEARVRELETQNGQLQEQVTDLTQEINMLKKLHRDIFSGQQQS
ncbi:CCAAT/enhancer-binding protein [Endozoicomonas arenosclerae]|uniref:CCAAT/enhancer-binding protein n=1 Tax=Endozoicomonas arenosclerae TaxID=1633495 RepID=UPI00078140D7|nr:CCAAT/enhancer-binding protein [Endozoicomonas arenosclerae]